MIRSALLALAVALAAPTIAHAGTSIAVGVAEGASVDATAAAVEAVTGGEVDRRLEDLGALVVEVDDPGAAVEAVASLPGVGYAERVGTRRLAFEPNDPLAFFQWYLRAIRAFEFWDVPPAIGPVRVAVIDSGIDGTHPEFQGRIAAAKTFVGGNPRRDELGHGTAVAGEIAASIDNAEGIAGVGLGVELLVAKVVDPRTNAIEIDDEAAAIRWAIENEAQVINLSLGGPRDPRDRFANVPDTFSNVERAAIDYAYENGAVVVAATGNTQPGPYPYASYPAALPHVLGVSAIDQSGKTPAFSNRDAVYNDLAAPGAGIVSTFPVELTDASCGWPGYNICARGPYAAGNGTSFSAPLASATAALLLGTRPQLLPSQVLAILELSAEPAGPAGRDPTTGNGVLDVAAALASLALPAPPADRHETNDDAGSRAHSLFGSRRHAVRATVDFYDDPTDVYRVYLREGRRVSLSVQGLPGAPTLVLWRPGTKHVTEITQIAVASGRVVAYRSGRPNPNLRQRIGRTGWYYVEVRAPKGKRGSYTLTISK